MKRSIYFLLYIQILVVIFPMSLNAQEGKDVDPIVAGVHQDIAPVMIDGKTLFNISGITSFPSQQRAATISKRIRKAAKNPSISIDSVKLIQVQDHYEVYAGLEFIMNIYNTDAQAEGININMLADLIQSRTKEAISLYRMNRTSQVLLKNLIYALGEIGILVICMVLLSWFTGWVNKKVTNRLKSRVDLLENKSYKLISSVKLWRYFNILFRTIKIILSLILILVFSGNVLRLFPWTNIIAVSAFKLIVNPLNDIGNSVLNYIPSFIFLIIIILITRYLLKLIRILFESISTNSIKINNFYPEWAIPTFKILRMVIVAFALVLAFPYIPGSNSLAFKGISVFIGVLFSLGSSSFISNLIAGYSMTYRRAFRLGDLIEADGHTGFVEEQKLLVTRLRSQKNEEIVIPNSTLLNSHIVNFSAKSQDKGLIIHTIVGIGYETPWRQVDAMLKLAADRTEGLMKTPPPYVLKRSLGDFAVNYEINAYVKDVSKLMQHYNHLHQNILDVFNENNVQIMTPAYEGDPGEPKVVPKDKWNMPLTSEN